MDYQNSALRSFGHTTRRRQIIRPQSREDKNSAPNGQGILVSFVRPYNVWLRTDNQPKGRISLEVSVQQMVALRLATAFGISPWKDILKMKHGVIRGRKSGQVLLVAWGALNRRASYRSGEQVWYCKVHTAPNLSSVCRV